MCPRLDDKLCGHTIRQLALPVPSPASVYPQAFLCSLQPMRLAPARQSGSLKSQVLAHLTDLVPELPHLEHSSPPLSLPSSTQLLGLISMLLFQKCLPLISPP